MRRTFDRRLCCDHLARNGAGWLQCRACGARCTRNEFGQIVTFTTRGADLTAHGADYH